MIRKKGLQREYSEVADPESCRTVSLLFCKVIQFIFYTTCKYALKEQLVAYFIFQNELYGLIFTEVYQQDMVSQISNYVLHFCVV